MTPASKGLLLLKTPTPYPQLSPLSRRRNTFWAKSGSVNPLVVALAAELQPVPRVVPLLTCCESGDTVCESSICTWESDPGPAATGISRTGIWGEIEEMKWPQFSIADRSELLLNLTLNLLQSFYWNETRKKQVMVAKVFTSYWSESNINWSDGDTQLREQVSSF